MQLISEYTILLFKQIYQMLLWDPSVPFCIFTQHVFYLSYEPHFFIFTHKNPFLLPYLCQRKKSVTEMIVS